MSPSKVTTTVQHIPGIPEPAVMTVEHADLLRCADAAREQVPARAEDRTYQGSLGGYHRPRVTA